MFRVCFMLYFVNLSAHYTYIPCTNWKFDRSKWRMVNEQFDNILVYLFNFYSNVYSFIRGPRNREK